MDIGNILLEKGDPGSVMGFDISGQELASRGLVRVGLKGPFRVGWKRPFFSRAKRANTSTFL
jgi:hypothetical protein